MNFIGSLPESLTQELLIGKLIIGGLGVKTNPASWVGAPSRPPATKTHGWSKHGSSRIRYVFDDLMLEPCLLQPCFHVAGSPGLVRAAPKLSWREHQTHAAAEEPRVRANTYILLLISLSIIITILAIIIVTILIVIIFITIIMIVSCMCM